MYILNTYSNGFITILFMYILISKQHSGYGILRWGGGGGLMLNEVQMPLVTPTMSVFIAYKIDTTLLILFSL